MTRALPVCGTRSAYYRHLRLREVPCDACTGAVREHSRQRRRNAGVLAPLRLPCGTEAAYQRHRYHGEQPCEDCRAAHNVYASTRRRKAV